MVNLKRQYLLPILAIVAVIIVIVAYTGFSTDYVIKGGYALELGDYERAADYFTQAVAQTPTPEGYQGLIKAYTALESYDNVKMYIDKLYADSDDTQQYTYGYDLFSWTYHQFGLERTMSLFNSISTRPVVLRGMVTMLLDYHYLNLAADITVNNLGLDWRGTNDLVCLALIEASSWDRAVEIMASYTSVPATVASSFISNGILGFQDEKVLALIAQGNVSFDRQLEYQVYTAVTESGNYPFMKKLLELDIARELQFRQDFFISALEAQEFQLALEMVMINQLLLTEIQDEQVASKTVKGINSISPVEANPPWFRELKKTNSNMALAVEAYVKENPSKFFANSQGEGIGHSLYREMVSLLQKSYLETLRGSPNLETIPKVMQVDGNIRSLSLSPTGFKLLLLLENADGEYQVLLKPSIQDDFLVIGNAHVPDPLIQWSVGESYFFIVQDQEIAVYSGKTGALIEVRNVYYDYLFGWKDDKTILFNDELEYRQYTVGRGFSKVGDVGYLSPYFPPLYHLPGDVVSYVGVNYGWFKFQLDQGYAFALVNSQGEPIHVLPYLAQLLDDVVTVNRDYIVKGNGGELTILSLNNDQTNRP